MCAREIDCRSNCEQGNDKSEYDALVETFGSIFHPSLEDNLFLVEFMNIGYKKRILEGRPWVFEGSLFLIEEFDRLSSPLEYTFDRAAFLVQMMNLLLACIIK